MTGTHNDYEHLIDVDCEVQRRQRDKEKKGCCSLRKKLCCFVLIAPLLVVAILLFLDPSMFMMTPKLTLKEIVSMEPKSNENGFLTVQLKARLEVTNPNPLGAETVKTTADVYLDRPTGKPLKLGQLTVDTM